MLNHGTAGALPTKRPIILFSSKLVWPSGSHRLPAGRADTPFTEARR